MSGIATLVLPRKSGALVKSGCLLLKIYRTDISHITMTTPPVNR